MQPSDHNNQYPTTHHHKSESEIFPKMKNETTNTLPSKHRLDGHKQKTLNPTYNKNQSNEIKLIQSP